LAARAKLIPESPQRDQAAESTRSENENNEQHPLTKELEKLNEVD
jgi:hypothetical protein